MIDLQSINQLSRPGPGLPPEARTLVSDCDQTGGDQTAGMTNQSLDIFICMYRCLWFAGERERNSLHGTRDRNENNECYNVMTADRKYINND